MTEKKHTPGPWVVKMTNGGVWVETPTAIICMMSGHGLTADEVMENASLIAAIPDAGMGRTATSAGKLHQLTGPTVAWLAEDPDGQSEVYLFDPDAQLLKWAHTPGVTVTSLIGQADAQAALAAQAVEIARLTAELAAPDALAVRVLRAQILELAAERDKYTRMFNAACVDLGLINESLCLDPNDGGAEPIIGAIEELTAERDGLKRDAELLPVAIAHLAEWVDAVQRNGSGWDDWDEHFKDAAYRPGPLRELIDKALEEILKESGK